MKTIPVKIPGSGYSIHVQKSDFQWPAPLGSFLKGKTPIIITNPRVRRLCLPTVLKTLKSMGVSPKILLLPDGEHFKNLTTVAKAYRELIRLGADRSTPILLLGGGVVGDMGGFVASTYLRGLPFVQIGTTLVAQVDSSIGGKLGIDLEEGKNLVGVFDQPKAVISHIPFLQTLSERELIGGLGEVLKYGIIEDASFFNFVCKEKKRILKDRDPEVLFPIVWKSAASKARIVSADEKESSLRMILNFGHTFGHAIERLTHYQKYHHGEAIAIGMRIAAEISEKLGHCKASDVDEVVDGLRNIGLPTEIPNFKVDQWIKALEVDKKSRGGMIHFICMKKIGEVAIQPLSPKELVQLLKA